MSAAMTKNCTICNAPFEPKKRTDITCSPACSAKANLKRERTRYWVKRDAVLAYKKARREADPAALETQRAYVEANREKVREWDRARLERDREKRNAASRARYAANIEKMREVAKARYWAAKEAR